MSQPKVLVAQLGARRHYLEPILFHQWGMLDRFYTDFYVGDNLATKFLRFSKIYSSLPKFLQKTLDRYDAVLEKANISHFPKFSYQYSRSLKEAKRDEIANTFMWAGREFCQRIIDRGINNANVVYGFNGASLELFEYAKAKNIRCILDQTLAERSYVNQLLLEEEQKWQDWSLTPFQMNDAWHNLAQREQKEQDLADRIICGSDFVKDSLIARGIAEDKISVISLGRCKTTKQHQAQASSNLSLSNRQDDGLKILFAGTVSLRKGIPYLLEALRQLKGQIPFTCKIAGSIGIKSERIAEYSDVSEFLGRVSRSTMSELYEWADVFVLPSICEGSAMVTYESLMSNLPVITTPNAGSIVRHKTDGLIVPIRSSGKIAEALSDIWHGDREIDTSTTASYIVEAFKQAENDVKKIFL